jgi:hypothetical protein
MTIPLFSVRMYENDKITQCYHDLTPVQVYDSIPMKDYTNSMLRDDIFAKMAYLMADESFSCCWSSTNKYVLISRIGSADHIHIPVEALRINLPPSPETAADKERAISCTVFCLRGTKRFLTWLNMQLPQL